MIVGETIRLTVTEARAEAFRITSAALTVTNPDGTAYTPAPTVRLSQPPEDETDQTWLLRANLTPLQGGEYRLAWTYQDDAGETITRPQRVFALWTDVPKFIRTRLQLSPLDLPNEDLDPEVAAIARRLLARYKGLGYPPGQAGLTAGSYNGLTGTDQDFFDEGCALLTCARLIGPLTTGGAVSDMILRKEGDTEYRYADTGRDQRQEQDAGDSYAGQNERVRFMREALEVLGQVSAIHAVHQARAAGFRSFTVSGPTRAAKAAGSVETLMSSVLRLITDDWFAEQDFEQLSGSAN